MRKSGILLHITSLPSRYGVGTLEESGKFIRFLKSAKQSYWQILPVTPTDAHNSPYAAPSAFAGNVLFIDAADLCKRGYVSFEQVKACRGARGIDYDYARRNKEKLLRQAFCVFLKNEPPADYRDFCEQNSYWLKDYALFCAATEHFGASRSDWPDEGLRLHKAESVAKYSELLADEAEYYVFCQYLFFSQWKRFRHTLSEEGIKLFGDIPMYVSYDSADVWAHPELFDLDEKGNPKNVAGVPPDYFSPDGQLWGNPLYDWERMKKSGYDWWMRRIEHCSRLFDVLRIDHFRAFDSYYAVPFGQKTAKFGRWKKGVGAELLEKAIKTFPELTIVAEDLGYIPQSVTELRKKLGIPGMKILQFAFDGGTDNPFLPQNYEKNCVAYLGTHDNDTTVGWWNSADESIRANAQKWCGVKDNPVRELMTALAESDADTVVFTMQDVAEKGGEYRMNRPGQAGGWSYMADSADLSAGNAKRLAALTEKTNRT